MRRKFDIADIIYIITMVVIVPLIACLIVTSFDKQRTTYISNSPSETVLMNYYYQGYRDAIKDIHKELFQDSLKISEKYSNGDGI